MRWFKRLVGAVVLCAVLLAAGPVTAEGPGGSPPGENEVQYVPWQEEATWLTTMPEQEQPGGGLRYGLEQLLSLPFRGMAKAILLLPGFQGVDQLVFQMEKPGYKAPEIGGVFYADEWNKLIMPWYRRFLALASSLALISLIVMAVGYRMVFSPANPRQMATLQETVWNLVVATLLVASGPLIARQLFDLNAALIDFVRHGMGSQGAVASQALTSSFEMINTGSPLLDSMIQLAYVGLMLHLNLIYMVRKFVLAVLIIVMPVVGWAWVSKGTRLPMLILLSEVATNALMSFTHAVVLALYLALVQYDGAGMFSTWWAKLFGISLIIPVAALLRRLIAGWLNFLGIDEEKWAGLALAGFGGVIGLVNVAGGALGAGGGVAARAAERIVGGRISGGGPGGGSGPAPGSVLPSNPAPPEDGADLSSSRSPVTAPAGAGAGPSDRGDAPAPGGTVAGAPNPVPVSTTASVLKPGGHKPEGSGWKTVEDFGGALGRMAGTVAGIAVAGGRTGGDPGAFVRMGEMLGRAPVAFAHRAVGVASAAKRPLDGFRWR